MKKSSMVWLALAWLLFSAAPAMAEFRIGFKVFVEMGYDSKDKEQTNNGRNSVSGTFIDMPTYSRIYGRFRRENVSGYFEVGLSHSKKNPEGVKFRKLYGEYAFGNFRLQAGQTEPLTARFMRPQYLGSVVETQSSGREVNSRALLRGCGVPNYNRLPVVNYTYRSGHISLQAGAFAGPGGRTGGAITSPDENADRYWDLPGLEFSAGYKTSLFYIAPGFAWGRVKWQGVPVGEDDAVAAWLVNMPFQINCGPAVLRLNPYYGRNIGAFTRSDRNGYGKPILVDEEFKDVTQYGGWVHLGVKFGLVSANLIYGYSHYQNDDWPRQGAASWSNDNYARHAYVANLPVAVATNFKLVPELGYYDHGVRPVDNINLGQEVLAGIQLQIE
ncbi:MAG: hypothetical protein HQK60_18645, partial [Deltaproteobacteria bacterium]|nr:hypothetical protein [Deltaproteobacteria bacterium]